MDDQKAKPQLIVSSKPTASTSETSLSTGEHANASSVLDQILAEMFDLAKIKHEANTQKNSDFRLPVLSLTEESLKALLKPITIIKKPSSAMPALITPKDIAWLWLNLSKAFGYQFVRCYGEKDNGVWYEALKDLTPEELSAGLRRVLTKLNDPGKTAEGSWPPNVKEFRAHCVQSSTRFKLPSVDQAFTEFENNQYLVHPEWSHPLISFAAKLCSPLIWEHSRGDAFAIFSSFYKALAERVFHGDSWQTIANVVQQSLEFACQLT